MSKKAERKLEYFIEELMTKSGPFLGKDQMLKMCESIEKNVNDGKDGNTTINFVNGRQTMDEEKSLLNGDTVVKIQRMYADEMDWIYIPEGERFDAVAYIGDVYRITRAFWNCKLEDGSDHISELEKIYVLAISKAEADIDVIQSASLTYFDNGKLIAHTFNSDYPEFEVIMTLISDIVTDINDQSPITSSKNSKKDNRGEVAVKVLVSETVTE